MDESPLLVDLAIDSLLNAPRHDMRSGAYHMALFPALEQVLDKVKDLPEGASLSVSWLNSFCRGIPAVFQGDTSFFNRAISVFDSAVVSSFSYPNSPNQLGSYLLSSVLSHPEMLKDPSLSEKIELRRWSDVVALLFNPQGKKNHEILCGYKVERPAGDTHDPVRVAFGFFRVETQEDFYSQGPVSFAFSSLAELENFPPSSRTSVKNSRVRKPKVFKPKVFYPGD